MTDPLTAWVAELSAALDLDAETVDVDLLLALARDAAHGVARPAAPITTFLVGLAAGRRGGDPAAISDAAAVATALTTSRDDDD